MKNVADQSYYHVQFIILYHLLKPNLFPSKCSVLTGVSFSHPHNNLLCFCSYSRWDHLHFQLPVRLPTVSRRPSQFHTLRLPCSARSGSALRSLPFCPEYIYSIFASIVRRMATIINATGATVSGPSPPFPSPLTRPISLSQHPQPSKNDSFLFSLQPSSWAFPRGV